MQIPRSRLTTREPLGTGDGGVREEKSEPWWSVTFSHVYNEHDCSMRKVLWDFGKAAVQAGGSHGVALLSHRRGSSSVLYVYVCNSYHHAHTDLHVCVHEARKDMYLTLQGEPVIRQFAETKEERKKMDVTMCYRFKNNFHLLRSILVM